jgi:hypothetical protein
MKNVLIYGVLLTATAGAAGWAREPVRPFESSAAAEPQGTIDELVLGRLRRLGIAPAPICSDAVFLRRVSLDAIGTLPTAAEARAFLADRDPDKRGRLVDRLLVRDEFADYWAMKWCDLLRVKSEFPVNLWPNAVQAYHHWIRTAVKENMPYDRFARELLTSNGSNFRVPQVNFYRAVQSREPVSLAQAVALTFMGVHAESWPKERWAGMAGFFAQLGYKSTLEWKEEIVFFDPDKGQGDSPIFVARKLGQSPLLFPDGTPARLAPGQDPRAALADWLISAKNPWFARNIANRVWSWLLGRGIIHEPDDIRPDNPPSNPELLALLERELLAAHYDLKHLFRLILKSQTYQFSSIPGGEGDRGAADFAHYPLRRLDAEVLIDAICQVTGTTEQYTSAIPEPFTFIPQSQRAIALADGSITSPFLEMFGRPARDTGLESERNNRPTAAQRLHLLNSNHIQRKLQQGPKLRALWQSDLKPREKMDELYLTVLSRFPTDEERKAVWTYNNAEQGKRKPDGSLVWALINSTEFLYRH